MIEIAVLASGRGSNFAAIQEAIEQGKINGTIKIVLSDKENAGALAKAEAKGIKSKWINSKAFSDKDAYEQAILAEIGECDLIILAGYMRILGEKFIEKTPCPIMNIHPALLPSFPGLHGQRQAIEYGVKIAGCTVHFVDTGLDSGPIIMQAAVEVRDDDDEDTLAARILKEEHRIYPEAVAAFARGELYIEGRSVKRRVN